MDDNIAKEKDEAARKTLQDQRTELAQKVIDARKRLKTYDDAYNAASERVIQEAGSDTVPGKDNIRNVSKADYDQYTGEQKEARLLELATNLPKLSDSEYKKIGGIREKIENGENLSQNEMGQFVEFAFNKMRASNNREIYEAIIKAGNHYGEIRDTIFTRYAASKEGDAKGKEMFPTDWEKVLAFAKKHKGWMMLLLMLLVGATVAVTAGAGAIPGAAVGGAGAAGGGKGLFEAGRRS